ncbi:histidine phosphatase family protein [Leucobacter luti]|uniref:histidine phosphatase family protein n=1 Tax=Leucobacter luti TaxID=340320 RepID=UPI001C687DE4|nr:histidine phosphatase family protein [Leucobacter luti]QYM75534.1 histidine phosphatase family protein [Leucobacter luti]
MTARQLPRVQPAVIALVRHGETDWNAAGRIQGRTEVPLNETGRAQAAATALALAEASASLGAWTGVRASPLGRAIETAEIIAAGLSLAQPHIDDALWERDFGPAEGVIVAEAQRMWPGLDVPGAEPLDVLAERTADALTRVLREEPGSIVVAHGAMLRTGLGHLTGVSMPRIQNGEVWLLHSAGAEVRVERLHGDVAEVPRTQEPA